MPLGNLFIWGIATREHSDSGRRRVDIRASLTLLGEVV